MSAAGYIVIILISFFAAAVNTTTGFGFGILTVTVYSFFIPSCAAATVSGMISILMSFTIAGLNITKVQWQKLLFSLPVCIVAVAITIHFRSAVQDTLIKRILGAYLILLSLYYIFLSKHIKIRATPCTGILSGIIGGVLTGLFSMGGPPLVMYYLAGIEDKNEYMATLQTHFVIGNIIAMLIRICYNQVTVECWKLLVITIIPVMLATWLGWQLFKRIDEQILRKGIYLFMVVYGCYYVVKG